MKNYGWVLLGILFGDSNTLYRKKKLVSDNLSAHCTLTKGNKMASIGTFYSFYMRRMLGAAVSVTSFGSWDVGMHLVFSLETYIFI